MSEIEIKEIVRILCSNKHRMSGSEYNYLARDFLVNQLDSLNLKRVEISNSYIEGLSKFTNYLKLPEVPPDVFHSFYGFPILINPNSSFTRKELVNFLEEHNIETRAFMGGDLSIQPAYRNTICKVGDDLKNTHLVRDNAFFIGCHPFITSSQVKEVINAFEVFFSQK